MQRHGSVARDRGVTTIPQRLRENAGIETSDELSWIELERDLWLVGPRGRPEQVAPLIETALLSRESPFPKLARRLLAGEIALSPRFERRYTPSQEQPAISEEKMILLGSEPPMRRRGRGRG